jgi:hypothetical protein
LSHLPIDTRLNDVIRPILEFIKSNDLKKEFIDNEKIEEKSPKF